MNILKIIKLIYIFFCFLSALGFFKTLISVSGDVIHDLGEENIQKYIETSIYKTDIKNANWFPYMLLLLFCIVCPILHILMAFIYLSPTYKEEAYKNCYEFYNSRVREGRKQEEIDNLNKSDELNNE